MLKMCEKVTKISRRTRMCKCRGRARRGVQDAGNGRSRSTATVRTDFVGFSRRFSILDIRSRFQSPFLGLCFDISDS